MSESIHPLPVLGDSVIFGIKNLPLDIVPSFGQFTEIIEEVPSGMAVEKAFNIFEDNPFGFIFFRFAFEEVNEVKKQSASVTVKPASSSCNREVLTRTSRSPYICLRNIICSEFRDVVSMPFSFGIIHGAVGPHREFVLFAKSDALHAGQFEAAAETADAGKEIDKS